MIYIRAQSGIHSGVRMMNEYFGYLSFPTIPVFLVESWSVCGPAEGTRPMIDVCHNKFHGLMAP